jgi:uncharacterized Zn-binding protein involved in type VI secretion
VGRKVCRKSDINQMKGAILNGDDTVLCNGKPVAVKGKSFVKPHPHPGKPPLHPINPVAKGDTTVLVGGKPMAFLSVPDSCKHIMIQGSDDVLVKGQMG